MSPTPKRSREFFIVLESSQRRSVKKYADYMGNSDGKGAARNPKSSRTRRHRGLAKAKFGHPDQDRHPADVSWVRCYQHCVGHFRRTTDRTDSAFPMSRAKGFSSDNNFPLHLSAANASKTSVTFGVFSTISFAVWKFSTAGCV